MKRCPRCGTELPEMGGAEGLCPPCLLALGLVAEGEDEAHEGLAPDAASSSLDAGAPAKVGPYRILTALGEGGMGTVYLAEQEEPLRRRVALKLIKRGMATTDVIARFNTERQALALMSHPGIAQVFDAGTDELGHPYFVMEHVTGVPITEYCDHHQLGLRDRLGLFVELCEAVQHAHTKGIIHRDLKPSNVLVTTQEGRARPKVIDFGVAKATLQGLTEKTAFTSLGVMIGTPGYTSPEQSEATGLDVDTRSDIYSLGVLLYELLVGAQPFDSRRLREAGWAEMQRIIREEEPLRPSLRLTSLAETATDVAQRRQSSLPTLARQLKGDLDWIALKTLEKDRTRRYQSASELAADIRRHLDDEPVTAGPPALGYRLRKAVRRHQTAFAVAAAALLAILAGLVVTAIQYLRAEHLRQARQAEVVRFNVAKGMELVDVGDRMAALPWLVEALRLEEDEGRRDAHRHRIASALEGAPVLYRMWTHAGAVQEAVFSRDGRIVASASSDGTARVWDLVTGEALAPPLRHEGPVRTVALSPDGRRVLTGGDDGTARVWETRTGAAVAVLRHRGPLTRVGFDPAGARVLTASEDDTATIWDAADGSPLVTVRHLDDVYWACFSPAGRTFATASIDGTARIWDVGTGRALTPILRHEGGVYMAAFSSDGRKLVTAGGDHSVRVWSARTGSPLTPPLRHRFNPASFADFSPDGRLLAVAAWDQRVYLWDLVEESHQFAPLELDAWPRVARFNPYGRLLVTGDDQGSVRLWRAPMDGAAPLTWGSAHGRVSTLQQAGPILRHPGGIRSAAFDASGRLLLTAGLEGTVRVWDLATSGAVSPPVGGWYSSLSDGGRALVTSGWGEGPIAHEGYARIWDALTGDPRTPPLRHAGRVRHAVSADGSLVATAGGLDRTVRLWDGQGEPLGAPLTHANGVWWVALDGGGRRVVALTDDPMGGAAVQVWDKATAREIRAPLTGVVSVDLGGHYVVIAGRDGAARIWDLWTGAPVSPPYLTATALTPGETIAMSPDGERLATADGDTLRLWSVSAGEPPTAVRRESSRICVLRFSADGARLVTGTEAGNVQVWDGRTGERIGGVMRHRGAVSAAEFSSDGRWLTTAGEDRVTRVWDARLGEPVSAPYPSFPALSAGFDPEGRRVVTSTGIQEFRADPRPVEDLQRLAHLLAGRRLTGATGVAPVPVEEIRDAWETLRRRHPQAFQASALQLQTWHREQAAALARAGLWPEALGHLQRALAAGPRRWTLLMARGRAAAELGLWADAEGDFAAALEMIPGELEAAYDLALLHLGREQRDRFERLRQSLLARWGRTQNPDRARWLAHTLVLAPIVDAAARAQGLEWSGTALAVEPERVERLTLLGAALVRAGRIEEGIEVLQQAIQKGGDRPPPSAFAYLSIAQRQCGRRAEEARWRARAEATLRELRAPGAVLDDHEWTSSQAGLVAWEQRAELRILLSRSAHGESNCLRE